MNRDEYQRRKLAGICAFSSACHESIVDDSPWCATHKPIALEKSRELAKTPRHRDYRRKYQAKRRRDRAVEGKCARCERPLYTKTLCREHAQALLEKWRATHPPGKRQTKCSGCGKTGHRVNSCQERPQDTLRIEDYATARRDVW